MMGPFGFLHASKLLLKTTDSDYKVRDGQAFGSPPYKGSGSGSADDCSRPHMTN